MSKKNRWVSVDEKLPGVDEYYLVACNSYSPSGRQIAFLENFGHPNWISDSGDTITEFVTHWRPLHNPPKK